MTENSVPLCLGGDSKVETTAIADLVDRLGNRLGFGRVTRLVPRESHLPERAVARLSVTKQAGRGAWQAVPPRQRPLRLLEPAEPVQATALMPDHPPALFRRGPVLHHITHAEGPERLLPEWWHVAVPDADLPSARDYFRVEDAEGRRYWLYREVAAGEAAPRWFLHGLFG
jgi:protein ImuB